MYRSIMILLAFCAIISPLPAAAQDWDAVDALVAPYDDANAPGISLAISIDGELVYQRWTGMADIAHNVPIDRDTRFDIGSVSKQFTAYAIMILADEGKLSLDDDVRTYIPELEAKPVPVTIRHLLNHTGGLREANSLLQLIGLSEASPITEARSLDLILRQHGENFPAGQREEYSNTGYQLLAEIVARVSGRTFPDFLRNEIFEPLGMDRTFVRADPSRIIDDLATSYEPLGRGFAQSHLAAATYGSTGIISTPRDLLRWANAFETRQIGGSAVVKAMAARSTLADGRRAVASNGQEYRDFRGLDTWSHGGSTGGFRSFLLRIPEAHMAIVVTANRSDFLKAAFAFDIAEALLADRLEPRQAAFVNPEPAAELDRYVGDYRLFAGVVFSIRREEDQLTIATFGKDDATPLSQVGKGDFLLDPKRQLRLQFPDIAQSNATQMRWQISDDGYILAPRVAMLPVPQTPLNIGELEGRYYCDTLQQVVALFESDGIPMLRMGDGKGIPLERYQPDTFRSNGTGSIQRVVISRDAHGAVRGLLVSAALANDIEYRKMEGDWGPSN